MATCFKNSSEIHYILFIDVENDAAYFLLLLCGCGCHQHMFRSFELTLFIYLFGFSLGAKDHYSVFILSTSQYSQNSGPKIFKIVQVKKLVKSKPENLIVSKKLANGWINFTVSESWIFFSIENISCNWFFLFHEIELVFLAWTFLKFSCPLCSKKLSSVSCLCGQRQIIHQFITELVIFFSLRKIVLGVTF